MIDQANEAQLVGVGRGVDLLIYVSLIGIGFLMLLLVSKIRDLENKVTLLTREVALQRAEMGAKDHDDQGNATVASGGN